MPAQLRLLAPPAHAPVPPPAPALRAIPGEGRGARPSVDRVAAEADGAAPTEAVALAGPALAGTAPLRAPALAGPALAGPALAGPALAGPALAGTAPLRAPALAGPALAGTAPLQAAPFQAAAPRPDPRRATLARLRALVGAPPVAPGRLPTGVPGLDVWLRGWPRPGLVEVAGLPGAGRLALVLPALAALTRQGRTVLVVDPECQLHPPGLGEVDLARFVLVRPPREQAAWAAEQVARSGAVDALLLLDLPPLGRAGLRLARAAEAGATSVFVVTGDAEADLPATLRLRADGWAARDAVRVRCTRSRDGRMEGERTVVVGAPA